MYEFSATLITTFRHFFYNSVFFLCSAHSFTHLKPALAAPTATQNSLQRAYFWLSPAYCHFSEALTGFGAAQTAALAGVKKWELFKAFRTCRLTRGWLRPFGCGIGGCMSVRSRSWHRLRIIYKNCPSKKKIQLSLAIVKCLWAKQ